MNLQHLYTAILHAARVMALGAALLMLTPMATPALAQQVTMDTLLDRIQIEDLLTRYYYDLSQGKAHELSDYFTEEVRGNRAIAHVVWTGISNAGVGKPPTIYEQGREDSELVKVNGKWLIKRRYISSDSGLPDRFDKTFKQRNTPLDWDK